KRRMVAEHSDRGGARGASGGGVRLRRAAPPGAGRGRINPRFGESRKTPPPRGARGPDPATPNPRPSPATGAGSRPPRAPTAPAALLAVAQASDPPFPAAAVGLHDAPPQWMGPAGARVAIGPDGLVVASDGVEVWPLQPDAGPAQLSPSSSRAALSGAV